MLTSSCLVLALNFCGYFRLQPKYGAWQTAIGESQKDVAISQIVPVGNYAVKLVFDDGHQTGLYSWAYLAKLAAEQDQLWADYLQRLKQANSNRDSQLMIKQVY